VILICRKSAEEFRSAYHLSEDQTAAIFGSVSLERFSPNLSGAGIREELGIPPGDTLVGMVSRMKPGRGHELAIRSFAIASRQDPTLHLALVGAGELKETLLRLVSEEAIEGTVRFLGRHVEDLPQVYAATDFVLYLSPGSDGACRALLESAASGRPAIGLHRGAIPEILEHNRSGLIAEDRTPETLARNISLLSKNKDLIREMGITARRNAEERFREEREYAETLENYRKAWALKYPTDRGAETATPRGRQF
jgi:glycosyltransferase involved in cell wall biosynthesis